MADARATVVMELYAVLTSEQKALADRRLGAPVFAGGPGRGMGRGPGAGWGWGGCTFN
jgi:hypothetical protein